MNQSSARLNKPFALDFSVHTIIKVSGKDHIVFLQNILTQDIASLKPGDISITALLSATSHVLSLFHILIFESYLLIVSGPNQSDTIINALEKLHILEDIRFENVSLKYKLKGFSENCNKLKLSEYNKIHSVDNSHEWSFKQQLGQQDIYYSLSELKQNFSNSKSIENASPLNNKQTLELRIQENVLSFDQDINEKVMLSETKLEKIAASETKGCYPGQEVVAKIETYGRLNRAITKVIFSDELEISNETEILNAEKKVIGWITSNTKTNKKTICFGYLKKGFYEKPCEIFINVTNQYISGITKPIPTFTTIPPII